MGWEGGGGGGNQWGTHGCYGAPIGAMGHPGVLWGHLRDNQGVLWGFINTERTGLMAFDHWADPTQHPTFCMGGDVGHTCVLWGADRCYGAPRGAMGTPQSQPGVAMGFL